MIDTRSKEHIQVDIEEINEMVKSNPKKLIDLSEQRYNEQLLHTANEVAKRHEEGCSILLISGPSASTKTTTAFKISSELTKKGINAPVISLDDFFIERSKLPKLENGDTDFESIAIVDIKKLKSCFDELKTNKKSDFPIFDFKNGKRSDKVRKMEMDDNTVIIMEGIHALNPLITQEHEQDGFTKLYVSAHSDFYLGGEMVLSARNTRFIRRAVRDYFHRGNSLSSTMKMWENVVKSEIVNIMPHRVNADLTIDSTVLYEHCIYKECLNNLLKLSELTDTQKLRMNTIVEALNKFEEMDIKTVAQDSVMHEFIS